MSSKRTRPNTPPKHNSNNKPKKSHTKMNSAEKRAESPKRRRVTTTRALNLVAASNVGPDFVDPEKLPANRVNMGNTQPTTDDDSENDQIFMDPTIMPTRRRKRKVIMRDVSPNFSDESIGGFSDFDLSLDDEHPSARPNAPHIRDFTKAAQADDTKGSSDDEKRSVESPYFDETPTGPSTKNSPSFDDFAVDGTLKKSPKKSPTKPSTKPTSEPPATPANSFSFSPSPPKMKQTAPPLSTIPLKHFDNPPPKKTVTPTMDSQPQPSQQQPPKSQTEPRQEREHSSQKPDESSRDPPPSNPPTQQPDRKQERKQPERGRGKPEWVSEPPYAVDVVLLRGEMTNPLTLQSGGLVSELFPGPLRPTKIIRYANGAGIIAIWNIIEGGNNFVHPEAVSTVAELGDLRINRLRIWSSEERLLCQKVVDLIERILVHQRDPNLDKIVANSLGLDGLQGQQREDKSVLVFSSNVHFRANTRVPLPPYAPKALLFSADAGLARVHQGMQKVWGRQNAGRLTIRMGITLGRMGNKKRFDALSMSMNSLMGHVSENDMSVGFSTSLLDKAQEAHSTKTSVDEPISLTGTAENFHLVKSCRSARSKSRCLTKKFGHGVYVWHHVGLQFADRRSVHISQTS